MNSVMNKISDWSTLTIENADDKKNATIDIEGVIGFEPWWTDDKKTTTKELMKDELKRIANLDVDHITVQINSYGGDVNHAVSMYDMLVNNPASVTTEIHGHTASAATIIAQAGNKRVMSSTALFLAHQAQTVAAGTADDMENGRKTLETINNQIASIYAKRAGKDDADMRTVMDRNNGLGEWITADEALELGFIDEISEPMAAAASAMPTDDMLAVWNIPEIPTNQEQQKEPNMFDRLKKMFNFSEEQAEILDALESIETIESKHTAKIDALVAEKEDLVKQVEALIEKADVFEAAAKMADELEEKVKTLEATNSEQAEKLAKMTANVKPVEQDTEKPAVVNIVSDIKELMSAENLSYENAYKKVLNENPEIHKQLVVSKRK